MQYCLYFAKLDTETTNLYLGVQTAKKLKIRSGKEPDEITSFIETCGGIRAKGIGNKLGSRQLRTIQVAASQSSPTDVEFARHAYRYRLKLLIQHICLHVTDGTTNGDYAPYGLSLFSL